MQRLADRMPNRPLRLRYRWLLFAAACAIGAAIGLGAFTFTYAKGYSYLTNDPAACANCHIMDEYYTAWTKSSHQGKALCNDCHTPHTPVAKWTVKASNGFWHSFYFTTGNFPYPLRITPRNEQVVEDACRHCHQQITATIDAAVHAAAAGADPHEALREPEAIDCTNCHRYVGHWVR